MRHTLWHIAQSSPVRLATHTARPNRINKSLRTDNSASRSRVSERNSEENDRAKNNYDLNDDDKDPRSDEKKETL